MTNFANEKELLLKPTILQITLEKQKTKTV